MVAVNYLTPAFLFGGRETEVDLVWGAVLAAFVSTVTFFVATKFGL
jgi:uncharacterized membrane protein